MGLCAHACVCSKGKKTPTNHVKLYSFVILPGKLREIYFTDHKTKRVHKHIKLSTDLKKYLHEQSLACK